MSEPITLDLSPWRFRDHQHGGPQAVTDTAMAIWEYILERLDKRDAVFEGWIQRWGRTSARAAIPKIADWLEDIYLFYSNNDEMEEGGELNGISFDMEVIPAALRLLDFRDNPYHEGPCPAIPTHSMLDVVRAISAASMKTTAQPWSPPDHLDDDDPRRRVELFRQSVDFVVQVANTPLKDEITIPLMEDGTPGHEHAYLADRVEEDFQNIVEDARALRYKLMGPEPVPEKPRREGRHRGKVMDFNLTLRRTSGTL